MSVAPLVDWARFGAAGLCIAAGSLLMLGAVIGLLRFPDVFTRLHAAGGTLALGASVSLFGLLVLSPSILAAAKIALLIALITAVTPVLSHIAGSAAHASGISPIVGAYAAPRPGKRAGSP
ncbi:MAG: monovalent cation/H(+) antiporter subunit G [Proteobacteria bacterium]|nr:monovalent cation/H(+) antiporter subunit G [Pseudomonadota bacterium]